MHQNGQTYKVEFYDDQFVREIESSSDCDEG